MNLHVKPEDTGEIDRSYDDALAAARGLGRTLLRRKKGLSFQQWTALLTKCGLTPDRAQRFIALAEAADAEAKAPPLDVPPPREAITVVCGWCLHLRAERGDPPRHISGPKEPWRIVHGVCADCEAAVERKLARLRRTAEPHGCTGAELTKHHAQEWDQVRARLRATYHFVDHALAQVRALGELQNVAVSDAAQEELEALTAALTSLSRLAAELVLVSDGDDYDDEAFRPGSGDP